MRFAVLGGSGQIGSSLLKNSAHFPSIELYSISRKDLDLGHSDLTEDKMENIFRGFDGIINASGYNLVDQAETDSQACFQINTEAVALLAQYCAQKNKILVQFSSDYVFNGSKAGAYLESDPTHPLSAYGKSKAMAEQRVAEAGGRYLIFRTSWVYVEHSSNFVMKMLALFETHPEIKVVSDQTGAPTYAPDIAKHTLEILTGITKTPSFPSGIYHLVNSGETTWFNFAAAILEKSKNRIRKRPLPTLKPLEAEKYGARAVRPKNSRLNLDLLKKTFGVKPRSWELALDECLANLKKGGNS